MKPVHLLFSLTLILMYLTVNVEAWQVVVRKFQMTLFNLSP